MNSLKQTLLLSIAVVSLIIGIHRTTVEGIQLNYWIFMITIVALMLYRHDRAKMLAREAAEQNAKQTPKPAAKGKSRNKK